MNQMKNIVYIKPQHVFCYFILCIIQRRFTTISQVDLSKTEALEMFLYTCYRSTQASLESSP